MVSLMAALLVLASSPRVSIDQGIPGKFDAGVFTQQVQTPPIPSVVTKVGKTKLERRIELAERLDKLKGEKEIKSFTIYWATMVVSDESDAAMVVLESDTKNGALFFYYKSGAWMVLPEEFIP